MLLDLDDKKYVINEWKSFHWDIYTGSLAVCYTGLVETGPMLLKVYERQFQTNKIRYQRDRRRK